MTNINKLVMEVLSPHTQQMLASVAKPALKQAAVWGGGALATHVLTRDKKLKDMTDEEKKSDRKKALASLGTGAGAGAVGSVV